MRESVSQTRKLSQVGQCSAPCCRGRNPPAARAASEPSLSVGLSVRLSPPAPHSLPHGSNTERAILKLIVPHVPSKAGRVSKLQQTLADVARRGWRWHKAGRLKVPGWGEGGARGASLPPGLKALGLMASVCSMPASQAFSRGYLGRRDDDLPVE